MYTVIGGLRSRTFRVLWMLEELEAEYRHSLAGPRSDEVRAHNPSGKIPVLIDDGAALTDSTAILTYLADKHGRFTHPAGTLDRARQDSHTHFLLDEFDAVLWTAARHSFILPEDRRVPQVKESLKWEYETALDRLDARLGDRPFLAGDSMTIPDIIATHCGNWAATAKFPDPPPNIAAYYDRLRARPAYQRVQKL